MAFTVDYWYRHSSDADRGVRECCQMMAGAETSGDIVRTVKELQAGDYEVQRIKVRTNCPRCKSNGRYVVKTFKRKPPIYKDCPTCEMTGFIGELDYPVPAEEIH